MDYRIEKISREDWLSLADKAHPIVFKELAPTSYERIDYALLYVDENDVPKAFITCREIASDVVYWQYGGAFPGAKGTAIAWTSYQAMTRWASERYSEILTYIENTNTPMLKFAMKIGYKIIGVRHYDGATLLEHRLKFKEDFVC